MEINETVEQIHQQRYGHFRIPEDGKQPYAHANNQKLASTREQWKAAVYADDENLGTLEKNLKSKTRKLFDTEVGVKPSFDKPKETTKETKTSEQYDKTGNINSVFKIESKVDELV